MFRKNRAVNPPTFTAVYHIRHVNRTITALPAEAGSENDSGLITLHLLRQQVGALLNEGIKEMCNITVTQYRYF